MKLKGDIVEPLYVSLKTLVLRLIIVMVVFSISMSMTSAIYGIIYFAAIPVSKQTMDLDFTKVTEGLDQ
jgi:hypothetical protein